MTAQPADGTAVILHLIEAARELHDGPSPDDANSCAVVVWYQRLAEWIEKVAPAVGPVGWEARTWGELEAGDRVAVGGQEAEVESALVLNWHVDPKSSEYRPKPLEHSVTRVKLLGRDRLYDMPTGGEVETLRGELGQERDRAASRRRAGLDEERGAALEHWAEDAAQMLAAAGLEPVQLS